MQDVDTSEMLVFPCRRWMSRDEDDHEICREMPAIRKGEPHLPGTNHNNWLSFLFLRNWQMLNDCKKL